jgi:hypothetical protein
VSSTGESDRILEFRVHRRSSSVSRVEMVFVGSDEEVTPMQALHPNISKYGEHLILK